MAKLGDFISPAKNIKCGDGKYPVLSMTMHDGIVLQSDRFKKSLASADQSGYKVVDYGQLVVGFPIDEGVLYLQRVIEQGIMSPAYNVWDVDYSHVDPSYFELSLHSPQAMQYYKENLRGSTARRRSLPKEVLLELPLKMPSMDEQKRVATSIDKLTHLIDMRSKQLDKLDELVKSRFIEMFGDPEFNTKQWPTKKLSQLCSISSSKRVYKHDLSLEGIPFLRISDLNELIDNIENTPELFIPNDKFNELKNNGLVPNAGDILVTSRGTLGRCYIVKECDEFYFQDGMISWLSNLDSQLTNMYLSHLFMTSGIQKQIESLQAGSTVTYLSIAMLKILNIILPPLDLQNQFADFVAQVDKSKLAVQKSLEQLEILKKALMQEYFG